MLTYDRQAPERRLRRILAEERMLSKRNFFSHLLGLLRSAAFYHVWHNLLLYFRRFRAITLCIRILSTIFSFLQTGTLLLLSTAIFLVVLPILGAWMLGILLTAWIESRRTNRSLAAILRGQRICILLQPHGESHFFYQNALDLTYRGYTVLVVSCHLLSTRGIAPRQDGRHFYITARQEEPRLWLVRPYYFFSLKKNVLSPLPTVRML